MDKILIRDAPFLCFIGILEHEKNRKQQIYIDIDLYTDILKAAESDNIKNTVDYAAVYDLIKREVENKRYNLIETMAETIAKNVLKRFQIKKIMVRIKKPEALSQNNVKYTAVEIIRPRT